MSFSQRALPPIKDRSFRLNCRLEMLQAPYNETGLSNSTLCPDWVNHYRNAMSALRPFIPQFLT